MTTAIDLELAPLAGCIAVGVHTALTDLLADDIPHAPLRDALVEHQVLVLRGASPTPEQHIALAEIFGRPKPPEEQNPRHPDHHDICVFDSDDGDKADKWHADETFTDSPVTGAVLTIRTRPAFGSDTIWATPPRPTTRCPTG